MVTGTKTSPITVRQNASPWPAPISEVVTVSMLAPRQASWPERPAVKALRHPDPLPDDTGGALTVHRSRCATVPGPFTLVQADGEVFERRCEQRAGSRGGSADVTHA